MIKLKNKISRWLRASERIRNTYRELSALNDKELNDIGISRCDIPRIARGGKR